MSRIGKMPINIPNGVKVEIADGMVTATGPLGTLNLKYDKRITIKQENNQVLVSRTNDDKLDRSMHGLYRALVANMVTGVSEGFKKALAITGVGYKAQVSGNKLVMNLGFSHQVEVIIPEGLSAACPTQTDIVISGIDKQKVGQFASKIRDIRPVEPYHGYGVRYADEVVIRKVGKTAGKK